MPRQIHDKIEMSYLVKEYMRKDVPTIDSDASALQASKLMVEKTAGHLIVLHNAKPAGIITERDLVSKLLAREKDPSKTKTSQLMSTPLITVDPDASVEEAVRTMVRHKVRRLAVVRDGIIYGMFTARDLAKNFNDYEDRVTKDIIKHMATFSLPF